MPTPTQSQPRAVLDSHASLVAEVARLRAALHKAESTLEFCAEEFRKRNLSEEAYALGGLQEVRAAFAR